MFVALSAQACIQGWRSPDILQRVVTIKLRPGHPYRRLQVLVKNLVTGERSWGNSRAKRHIETTKGWIGQTKTLCIEHLVDRSLCPDHRLWVTDLSHYCLPLAMLLHASRIGTVGGPGVADHLRLGSMPSRHQAVLFERQVEAPLIETEASETRAPGQASTRSRSSVTSSSCTTGWGSPGAHPWSSTPRNNSAPFARSSRSSATGRS
jgi:hypothetical protein